MRNNSQRGCIAGALVGLCIISTCSVSLHAKHKGDSDQDSATVRLFQLLDSTRNGKLEDFYLLADLYKDPGKPDEQLRHVLRVEYDKSRAFGKLRLYVRSVGQMTDEQLSAYSPKQIYDFGEADLEKFVKTSTGSFGGQGDVYLRAGTDSPLATAAVTDETRKEYETFLTEHILPALQKK
jgi:hypothetical protein